MTSRRGPDWHRVFHPLCGADPLTLLGLPLRHGAPSPTGAPRYALALASSLLRAPFTLAEAAWAACERRAEPPPPVFIVGHMRSGTTHLHNVMAASGVFDTVHPVPAGLPWEARGLARLLGPVLSEYLPETRLIDAVAVRPDSPTEDEVALANICALSYMHAVYFPRRFRAAYRRGLLLEGCSEREVAGRDRRFRRYLRAMAAAGRGRPLLLKNPAYTAQVGRIARALPEARFVHIHRDPREVFVSSRRMLAKVLAELALQEHDPAEVERALIETYPEMMARLEADAAALPRGRLAHVAFERLEARPLEELERVWRELDLPERAPALDGMARYLDSIRDYRRSPDRPNAREAARVEAAWGPFVARYGTSAVAGGGTAARGSGR